MTTTQSTETTGPLTLNADDTALAYWLAAKIVETNAERDAQRWMLTNPGDQDIWSSAADWNGVAETGFQCIPVITACRYNGYRFLRDYRPANWEGVKIFADLLAADLPS